MYVEKLEKEYKKIKAYKRCFIYILKSRFVIWQSLLAKLSILRSTETERKWNFSGHIHSKRALTIIASCFDFCLMKAAHEGLWLYWRAPIMQSHLTELAIDRCDPWTFESKHTFTDCLLPSLPVAMELKPYFHAGLNDGNS